MGPKPRVTWRVWTDGKEDAGWLRECCVPGAGSGGVGVGSVRNRQGFRQATGFRRLRALPTGAKSEFLALFPTPNESSFRTLTCLLDKPQEGSDAALVPCLPG